MKTGVAGLPAKWAEKIVILNWLAPQGASALVYHRLTMPTGDMEVEL